MKNGLCIGLVGPLPPPSGGMANQAHQLMTLWQREGLEVHMVQVNAPYKPAWIGHVKGVRALARLLPYLFKLWRCAGQVQLFHILANSGWSWHLFAAPAIWIAKLRGIPVIVNYRGGDAERFFARSYSKVALSLKYADTIVVPSRFLQAVFAKWKVETRIVPNIINLERFSARDSKDLSSAHILVTRNLEKIYDIATALHAFRLIKNKIPGARLTIAGSGPEQEALLKLSTDLCINDATTFTGRLDNQAMAALYQKADLMINPSLVDNMPISILEAWASGVPIVSTNVGGIPYLAEHDKTALLVNPANIEEMAQAALSLLHNPSKAAQLVEAGLRFVQQFSWPQVREKWLDVYLSLLSENGANSAVQFK